MSAKLAHRVGRRACPHCGAAMTPRAFDMTTALTADAPKPVLRRSLAAVGFRDGDIATLTGGAVTRRVVMGNART